MISSARPYRRRICLLGLALALIVAGSSGCKTSQARGVDPFAAADQEEEADLLDEPVDQREARPRTDGDATVEGVAFELPEPPESMSKQIDAEVDDWDANRARAFDSSRFVVEGEQFWSGADDASFRVNVDSDAGHVYFWIDVRDERVVDAGSEQVMADGIVLWLRDPKLEAIVEALPAAVRRQQRVRPEMAILFTPDGQFWRYDDKDGQLYRAGIEAKTKKMANGYRLEAAVTLGVLGQVASLPTEDIAFRVELMDGDEPDRRGEQTRMSMLPDETGPRFALYNVGGWLPYQQAKGQPPRPGALGRWMRGEQGWTFDSFEVVPTHWLVMQDVSGFDAALANSDTLAELCPAARAERELVEAYQSRSGRHRAGLVLCGSRAPGGQCPDDAQSHLYWVHLQPDGQGWKLANYSEVTPDPLAQCPNQPADDVFYTDFSLVPLEMLGSSVWGVGWTARSEEGAQKITEKGVWFFKAGSKEPYLGKAPTEKIEAASRSRSVSTSRVYLTPVDDAKGLDICEVEKVEEQTCRATNRGCQTGERGKTVRTHIKMWSPKNGRFEPYLLSKHRRCGPSFDFGQREGYMLLHEAGRLGVMPSPAN